MPVVRRRTHLVVPWSRQVCRASLPLCARLRWFLLESCVWPDLGWWSWRCAVLFRCLSSCCSGREGLVIPTGPCSRGSPPYFLQLGALCHRSSVSDGLQRRLWRHVVVSSSKGERCELLYLSEQRVLVRSGGFFQNGAFVVLVEVLPGLACVASAVLLAAVFSLIVCVLWSLGLCILVKVLPKIALCRFWRRFFLGVLCVRFGPPLCCPYGLKCVVRLGCILVRFSQDGSWRFLAEVLPKAALSVGGDANFGALAGVREVGSLHK
ncbi:hypothetical protein Taro_020609, partial [Colocasia esculenta]|nr:hypothetical protein [Colocasia esculenta]